MRHGADPMNMSDSEIPKSDGLQRTPTPIHPDSPSLPLQSGPLFTLGQLTLGVVLLPSS